MLPASVVCDVEGALRPRPGDELADGLRGFLDEGPIEEAELFVDLGELAFEHFLDDVRGVAGKFPCMEMSGIEPLTFV
jgi:hypothetical protein